MTDPQPPDRDYPVVAPDGGDPRFTHGLQLDVAAVLEQHGYPPVRKGADFVELGVALFGFLYGESS